MAEDSTYYDQDNNNNTTIQTDAGLANNTSVAQKGDEDESDQISDESAVGVDS